MNIGRLDKRISILVRNASPNSYGAVTDAWTHAFNAWATVKYVKLSEDYRGDFNLGEQVVEFTIRYNSQVTTSNKIEYGGSTYDVMQIGIIGRNEGMTMRCKATDLSGGLI